MDGVLIHPDFAKRIARAVKVVEAEHRSGRHHRRNPAPAYRGTAALPARIMSFVSLGANRWEYRAKPVKWNFSTLRFDPPAAEVQEIVCYNARESHNDGTGQEGEGVTVGVFGNATITMLPIMVGCHVFLFRAHKPAEINLAAETVSGLPATVYLFEAPNAVSVTCSA